jgi:hypothetical protein
MTEKEEKNNTYEEEEEEKQVEDATCPMDGCESKKNPDNKKRRCDACQKWWYESKRIFFGRERKCSKCQEIFEPETRDEIRDKNGYTCDDCVDAVLEEAE